MSVNRTQQVESISRASCVSITHVTRMLINNWHFRKASCISCIQGLMRSITTVTRKPKKSTHYKDVVHFLHVEVSCISITPFSRTHRKTWHFLKVSRISCMLSPHSSRSQLSLASQKVDTFEGRCASHACEGLSRCAHTCHSHTQKLDIFWECHVSQWSRRFLVSLNHIPVWNTKELNLFPETILVAFPLSSDKVITLIR